MLELYQIFRNAWNQSDKREKIESLIGIFLIPIAWLLLFILYVA